jgi:RNA-directed DNA polymerase
VVQKNNGFNRGVFPLHSHTKLRSLVGYDFETLSKIADKVGQYYSPFDLFQKGKWRHIDRPTGLLVDIQKRIQRKLLSTITFPGTLVGAIPGKSIVENASFHTGKAVVVAIDLRDCFPRTSHIKVFSSFREILGCTPEISNLLTKLTTFHRRAPQGTATSPTLVNLTLLPLHDEIAQICRTLGLVWSFYIDDIVFSGVRARVAIGPIIKAVQRHGHAIRHKKIKIMPHSELQKVTGLVVNEKISLPKEYTENLRREILAISELEVIPEQDLQSVKGKINYVKRVCPVRGISVEKFAEDRLPEVGQMTPKDSSRITRECHDTSVHNYYKKEKTTQNLPPLVSSQN